MQPDLTGWAEPLFTRYEVLGWHIDAEEKAEELTWCKIVHWASAYWAWLFIGSSDELLLTIETSSQSSLVSQ